MAREFEYTIDSEFDYTIDEKGNTFIALRKIDWGNKGEYKLDIRKYYASESGETMSKGLSFLTEDGPDELTKVLIETGYGDDDEIANSIIENRPVILGKIYASINKDPYFTDNLVKRLESEGYTENDDNEEEFYDPEELLEDDE